MAKGVKKIKWVPRENDAKVFPTLSIANKLLAIEPDKFAWFEVSEWEDGTTQQDKKKDITWIRQDKSNYIIGQKTLPSDNFYGVRLTKKLCGPYTYYLEASSTGKPDATKNRGLKYRGHCEAKIVSSKWSSTNDGEDQRSKYFKYGHLIYLNLETEGLNGVNNLIVDVYKIVEGGGGTSDDKHVATYTNVQVIDGEVNLKMGNTSSWFVHARNDIEKFYVKVKAGNRYITDGKDAIHARFLQMKKDLVTSAFEPSTNQTPLKVGESTKNFYSPILCKYEKITIHDKDSNKEPFDITVYEEKITKLTQLYETVASSDEAKSKLNITLENLKTQKCYTEPQHKQEIEIYINNVKQKTEVLSGGKYSLPIEAEANKILLRAKPELFFITPDPITQYKLVTKTCAKPNNPIIINVYPNVEREVAFLLSLFGIKGYNRETNVKNIKDKDKKVINRIGKRDVLTGYNGEKGMKLVDGQLEILEQKKGALGFAVQAKVKVDNTVSSIELGKTKNQIKELIGFYHKIIDLTKDFDGRGKETTSLAYIKGSYPKFTFDIEPPNVAFALRMTNRKIANTTKVVTEYSGGLALKPITTIKIGVDLISLIPYFGLQGKIASEILKFCTEQADIEIYVIFEISFQARAEFNLAYNEIEGLKAGKQKLELEALATGKIGIKSKEKVTLTIVTSDGTTDKADVEKFKGEGGIAAGLLYSYEINGDKKGMYSQHKLEFTGLKATIIVYALNERRKFNTYFKKEFSLIDKPDEPWCKSNKDYF